MSTMVLTHGHIMLISHRHGHSQHMLQHSFDSAHLGGELSALVEKARAKKMEAQLTMSFPCESQEKRCKQLQTLETSP